MFGTLGKVAALGFGVLAITREMAGRVVGSVATRGMMSQVQARGLLDDLVTRGEKERNALGRMAREQVEEALGALGLATRRDLANLEARLRGSNGAAEGMGGAAGEPKRAEGGDQPNGQYQNGTGA